MPGRGAAVSRVLEHGFPPLLNPAVEHMTCTLRIYTDIAESCELVHKTIAVTSVILIHAYIHAISYGACLGFAMAIITATILCART